MSFSEKNPQCNSSSLIVLSLTIHNTLQVPLTLTVIKKRIKRSAINTATQLIDSQISTQSAISILIKQSIPYYS